MKQILPSFTYLNQFLEILDKLSSGSHFNTKMPSHQFRDSHYRDKIVSQPSYFYNGNTHTWKDSLYI